MKGRNTYGIVILKSLYCLNVYERQKYIWYCNIKEFVLFKCILQYIWYWNIKEFVLKQKYIWYCNVHIKSLYCLNVYERQKYIWYCNIKEFVLFKCI